MAEQTELKSALSRPMTFGRGTRDGEMDWEFASGISEDNRELARKDESKISKMESQKQLTMGLDFPSCALTVTPRRLRQCMCAICE